MVRFGLDLPVVFGEAVEHLHAEVVLARRTGGDGVHDVNGLDEGVVVIAGVGVGVAGLAGEGVRAQSWKLARGFVSP